MKKRRDAGAGSTISHDEGEIVLPMALFHTGLSDHEIDELARFLHERALPKGGMEFSMLDGYLTAIVSGPEHIPPSDWRPQILGNHADGEMTQDAIFKNLDEAQHFHGLVLRRMNEITRTFERHAVEPMFHKRKNRDGADSDFVDFWCLGYIRGVLLRKSAWDSLMKQDGDEGTLFEAIFTLASPFLCQENDDSEDLGAHGIAAFVESEKHAAATERVPHAACAIYAYWKERRRAVDANTDAPRRPPPPQ
jgi:uncharacterized protein